MQAVILWVPVRPVRAPSPWGQQEALVKVPAMLRSSGIA
jgi:hypothetical protein